MTTEEQIIWKRDYVQPLFDKYVEIPTKLKYMIIEKDYTKMFSKSFAQDQMRYMYDDSETFIFALDNALSMLSKAVRKNILKKYFESVALDEYWKVKESGMFWEFFPKLSGVWYEDKDSFINFIAERENKKEYIKLVIE
jgi:hypothetical protein